MRPPDARGDGSAASRSRRLALSVGAAVAVLALARLLVTGNPFVGPYSEDGTVFLPAAASSTVDGLLGGFAGYGHLLPRLLATATVRLPIGWWPAVAVSSSLVVAGLLAAYVADASRRAGLRGWRPSLAASVPLLLPGAGHELIGNWANLQWLLAYAASWSLATGDRRRDAVVLFFASATSPVIILLAPLLVVSRRPGAALAPFFLGSLFHLAARLLGDTAPHATGRHPGALGSSLGPDVLRGFVRAFVDTTNEVAVGWRAIVGAVLVLALCTLVAVDRGRTSLAFLASALVLACGTAYASGDVATRYSATTAALLLAAGLVTAFDRPAAAVAAVAVVLGAVAFSVPERRVEVVPWEPVCHVDGRARAEVGPVGFGTAVLPCSVVDDVPAAEPPR